MSRESDNGFVCGMCLETVYMGQCACVSLLDASEADPSSKSAAASPAQQEEDAIGNRHEKYPPLAALHIALHGNASAYVKEKFEGFAVRQERLRASRDSQAIAGSTANTKALMAALKTSFSS